MRAGLEATPTAVVSGQLGPMEVAVMIELFEADARVRQIRQRRGGRMRHPLLVRPRLQRRRRHRRVGNVRRDVAGGHRYPRVAKSQSVVVRTAAVPSIVHVHHQTAQLEIHRIAYCLVATFGIASYA